MSETEKRITKKLDSFGERLDILESVLGLSDKAVLKKDEASVISPDTYDETNKSRIKDEISDFHSELEGIKQLFKK